MRPPRREGTVRVSIEAWIGIDAYSRGQRSGSSDTFAYSSGGVIRAGRLNGPSLQVPLASLKSVFGSGRV